METQISFIEHLVPRLFTTISNKIRNLRVESQDILDLNREFEIEEIKFDVALNDRDMRRIYSNQNWLPAHFEFELDSLISLLQGYRDIGYLLIAPKSDKAPDLTLGNRVSIKEPYTGLWFKSGLHDNTCSLYTTLYKQEYTKTCIVRRDVRVVKPLTTENFIIGELNNNECTK